MARKLATLPGGPRLSDYLSVGVIGQVFPVSAMRSAWRPRGVRAFGSGIFRRRR